MRKIKAYFEREQYIWDHNGAEIKTLNNKMLCLLLWILFIGAGVLSIIVTLEESFHLLRVPYYTLFVCASVLLRIVTLKKISVATMPFLYITHTMMFLFALYGACVVVPNTRSTLVIGFAFVFCVTMFDKMLRVNLTMVLLLVNYILFVTPMKTTDIAFADAITVIGLSVVAMVLGGYLRQLQLDNIELRRQSRVREATDALTGLLSRAQLLEIEAKQDMVGKIAAVMMMDIDYFKGYNDTYGHQQGDDCLRRVSALFLEIGHTHGISFFRYGGEEFLGIVWNREVDTFAICQALLQQVRALDIVHEGSPFKHVTLSIGCSLVAREYQKPFEKLIAQADQALYQSKDAGRNQAKLYQNT